MKKLTAMIMSLFTLNACNNGGGSSGSVQPITPASPWNSYAVTSAADLPTCTGDIVGRLYFLETENEFRVCKSTGWTTIVINGTSGTNGSDGSDGTNGISVTTNKTISVPGVDYCTQFTGEDCYFRGGQIVTYSDNSFMINTFWAYNYVVSGDTDLDESSSSFYFPSSYTGAQIRLHSLVARGGGYKSTYLVYIKSSGLTQVWLDADNDRIAGNGTDELLYTATLSPM